MTQAPERTSKRTSKRTPKRKQVLDQAPEQAPLLSHIVHVYDIRGDLMLLIEAAKVFDRLCDQGYKVLLVIEEPLFGGYDDLLIAAIVKQWNNMKTYGGRFGNIVFLASNVSPQMINPFAPYVQQRNRGDDKYTTLVMDTRINFVVSHFIDNVYIGNVTDPVENSIHIPCGSTENGGSVNAFNNQLDGPYDLNRGLTQRNGVFTIHIIDRKTAISCKSVNEVIDAPRWPRYPSFQSMLSASSVNGILHAINFNLCILDIDEFVCKTLGITKTRVPPKDVIDMWKKHCDIAFRERTDNYLLGIPNEYFDYLSERASVTDLFTQFANAPRDKITNENPFADLSFRVEDLRVELSKYLQVKDHNIFAQLIDKRLGDLVKLVESLKTTKADATEFRDMKTLVDGMQHNIAEWESKGAKHDDIVQLSNKLNALEQSINDIGALINGLTNRVDGFEGRIKSIEDYKLSNDENIRKLNDAVRTYNNAFESYQQSEKIELEAVKKDVQTNKEAIKLLTERFQNAGDFDEYRNDIDKRMNELNTHVQTELQTHASNLNEYKKANQQKIDELTSLVNSSTVNITNEFNEYKSSVDGKISELDAKVQTQNADIANLRNSFNDRLTAHEADNEARFNELSGRIDGIENNHGVDHVALPVIAPYDDTNIRVQINDLEAKIQHAATDREDIKNSINQNKMFREQAMAEHEQQLQSHESRIKKLEEHPEQPVPQQQVVNNDLVLQFDQRVTNLTNQIQHDNNEYTTRLNEHIQRTAAEIAALNQRIDNIPVNGLNANGESNYYMFVDGPILDIEEDGNDVYVYVDSSYTGGAISFYIFFTHIFTDRFLSKPTVEEPAVEEPTPKVSNDDGIILRDKKKKKLPYAKYPKYPKSTTGHIPMIQLGWNYGVGNKHDSLLGGGSKQSVSPFNLWLFVVIVVITCVVIVVIVTLRLTYTLPHHDVYVLGFQRDSASRMIM